ncbi:hypothetical protein B0H14DRAFT_3588302 [Mycena olivaceomarginata]|nr:hypothetical protein B0H14DRAFT_3588302 [Mycena olivaceomarginata]
MSDTELSSTSSEDEKPALTAVEKGKQTRARKLAEEQVKEAELHAETAGGRQAKKDALKKKGMAAILRYSGIPSQCNRPPPSLARGYCRQPIKQRHPKRPNPRITQLFDTSEDDASMDVDIDEPPAIPKKTKVAAEKPRATEQDSVGRRKPANKKKTTIDSDQDNSGPEYHVSKPPKSLKSTTVERPKPKPKAKQAAASDDSGEYASHSEEDDTQSADESLSGEDDGTGDQPKLIQRVKSAPVDDDLLNFGDFEIPTPHNSRQRRRSVSSSGSVPPDTDLEWEQDDNAHGSALGLDGAESEEDEDKGPHRLTVQQQKYNQEASIRDIDKPKIRRSRVLHEHEGDDNRVRPESSWHSSARIVFPATGGQIKLFEQGPVMKRILKNCIERSLYDLAYKNSYESNASRPGYISKLVRRVAKKDPDGSHIEKRAKKDMKFCGRLALIVCPRGGNVRSDLRKGAVSKVATLYELNKPGITPSQIRQIVKQLIEDQHYIFPYQSEPAGGNGSETGTAPQPADHPGSTLDNGAGPKPAKLVVRKSTAKSLGFKHLKDLESHQKDRPNEVVLPDAMICVAGANLWAALLAWQTGYYVPAPEFNQARLEGTYKSLVNIMESQRSGPSAKVFNKCMHELYLKVSGARSVVASGSGSANNIISLDVDSE